MPAFRFLLSLVLIGSAPAFAAATAETPVGQVLYRTWGSFGGVYAVDAGTGSNFYSILPNNYYTSNFNGTSDQVKEFTQARTNARIAFSSTANPNDSERIYVINGDGTGLRQVTFHDPNATYSEPHYLPAISADGSKIAYINAETIAPPGTISGNGVDCSGSETAGLWVVNSDGSNPHLIRSQNWAYVSYCNAGAVLEAAWSPDGTKLIVKDSIGDPAAHCGNEVVVINADGTGVTTLYCNQNWGNAQHGVDWSPDGAKAMALVACAGSGYGPSCLQWDIWDTSTWNLIAAIPDPGMIDSATRFSPDSRLLAYPNPPNISIMDLSGNPVSTINTGAYYNIDQGSLWWASGSPGTLASMTLGVPSVYVNACPGYSLWLGPSVYNSSGSLVTHGFSATNVNINYGGDGDSWLVDAYGFASFNPGRGSATGTLQLINTTVSSNTVPLTADATCTCQSAADSSLSISRGGLRYVATSQNQFMQTLTVKNVSSSPVPGPINVVIESLSGAATLTNPGGRTGCTQPGSPYVNVVPAGSSLAAGSSASTTLYFRDPSLTGFTYSTAVSSGAGAP